MRKKALICCEESQRVAKSFRKYGVEAYSCDLVKCSGGHPEIHIICDALKLINGNCTFATQDGKKHKIVGKWDILICHPPCTFLSNAGARWLYSGGELNKERYKQGLKAKKFFMQFYDADCDRIVIENPIPSKIFNLPNYDQVVQPYMWRDYYDENYTKKTCLWLKNVPNLIPDTKYKNKDTIPYITSGSYSITHNPKYSGVSRSGGSSVIRSKTFKGIATAMAMQWSNIL